MYDPETQSSVLLQQKITKRFVELGFTKSIAPADLARNLAQFVTLSSTFKESTFPLFLTLDEKHGAALVELVSAIRTTLAEMQDVLVDVDSDLLALEDHLRRRA